MTWPHIYGKLDVTTGGGDPLRPRSRPALAATGAPVVLPISDLCDPKRELGVSYDVRRTDPPYSLVDMSRQSSVLARTHASRDGAGEGDRNQARFGRSVACDTCNHGWAVTDPVPVEGA